MPIRLTRAVKALLLTCFVAFLIQQTGDQFLNTHLLAGLGLIPATFIHQHFFWQLFTYPFFHADVMHLFFNLMMLAFIGSELESLWGASKFLRYFFFCSSFAGLTYLFLQLTVMKGGGSLYAPMIGASSAIYGLLVAYGVLFSERILLFMMIFPMRAKHFVWVLALIELLTTLYSPGGGPSSVAHLGGIVAGFCYLWGGGSIKLFRKRFNLSKFHVDYQKKKRSKHLKLIVNNEREFESPDEGKEDDPKIWH